MRFFLSLVVALVVAGSVERSAHPFGDAHAARTPRVRVVHVPQLTTIRLTLAFACIHRFEGAWDADTGNGYYGGLQMDADFERTYGRALLRRFGHANHWPAADQVAVAIRAFKSGRGFGPWPRTRRSCGV